MTIINNKRILCVLFIALIPGLSVFAQKELQHSRKGNRLYRDNNFPDAELSYRRSVDVNPEYSDAIFNLGTALYKQGKYDDALKSFESVQETDIERKKLASTYYNLGNTLFNSQKLEESIEAYKNSLRNDPGNLEAKYNLAYAQDLLK
ncbi:MAG: tetratricopeptide repeat protein, partial [Marinilabiliaceae bacterium]|nr:tetratricopeptide repeat protein [Marinilabiliaceae bacterium]